MICSCSQCCWNAFQALAVRNVPERGRRSRWMLPHSVLQPAIIPAQTASTTKQSKYETGRPHLVVILSTVGSASEVRGAQRATRLRAARRCTPPPPRWSKRLGLRASRERRYPRARDRSQRSGNAFWPPAFGTFQRSCQLRCRLAPTLVASMAPERTPEDGSASSRSEDTHTHRTTPPLLTRLCTWRRRRY